MSANTLLVCLVYLKSLTINMKSLIDKWKCMTLSSGTAGSAAFHCQTHDMVVNHLISAVTLNCLLKLTTTAHIYSKCSQLTMANKSFLGGRNCCVFLYAHTPRTLSRVSSLKWTTSQFLYGLFTTIICSQQCIKQTFCHTRDGS